LQVGRFQDAEIHSFAFNEADACKVNDAPPASSAGVELQNADLIQFGDTDGTTETNETAGTGVVNINY
jgi:hypothetical protein